MKFFYILIGAALLISVATWQLWNVFPSSQGSSSLDTPKAHGHDHVDKDEHIDEHDHQEESAIRLSPDQIKDFGIQREIAGPGKLSVLIATRGKIILHPDKIAHILPKMPGVAKEARKNIGDSVIAGEILAILESREMAEIKANYLAAIEKESLGLSLWEREKRLYEKKVSSQQDYLNAKSAYIEAKIQVQLAKQKLRAFGIDDDEIKELSGEQHTDLRLYDIRSPMDGVVIARHINKGEFIENTTTIYEIVDLSVVWIEIGIYPKDLVKIKKGQMVGLSLPADGETAQAKIIYLSPIIKEETITAKAIAELKNPNGNWRPGSFVTVNIAIENAFVPLAISKEAIQEIDGKEFVFVRVPEGFEKREVRGGRKDNEYVEILSGLRAGEEYASSKTFLLKADIGKGQAEHEH